MNVFKKIPFFVSSTLLLFSVLAFFFLYQTINTNNKKAELATIELENEIINRNELETLNASIETIKENSEILSSHFVKSSNVVPFLNTIEALAPISRVKAETTSVDVLEGNNGLTIRINASGDFDDLYKFLILLENSPYELEFITMQLQKESTTQTQEGELISTNSNWSANFTIKLLSFIQ